MQKLVWQNSNGDEVDLTKAPYGITNWEGFSNTSLNIQSQQVPFQDGGVFLDALMEQRELTVTLAMYDGNNLEERYRMRRELIHALNPKLGEGYLIYTNDFISKRIKCVAQIPLFETHNSNDSGTPKASLTWTACEPYWEDLEETEIVMLPNIRKNIVNNGDVNIGVKIECVNQGVTNFQIKNDTQNKEIKVAGYENNEIFIDTTTGNKKAYTESENVGFSIYGYNITKICYSDEKDLYVAIGNDRVNNTAETTGCVLVSKDLKRWQLISSEYNIIPRYIIYSKTQHKFVIAYDKNLKCGIKYSEDGYNWIDNGQVSTNSAGGIAYSDELDLYILACGGSLYKSSDLTTWESVGTAVTFASDIIWTGDKFVCVGYGCMKSIDGDNWSNVILPTGRTYTCISYLEGVGYVIGTEDGVVAFSDLSLTIFYNVPSPLGEEDVTGIASYKNIGFYAVAGNKVSYSGDGKNWNLYKTLEVIQNGVMFSNKAGDFITYGKGGSIYSLMTNDISVIGIESEITDIVYADHLGMYIATSVDTYVYKSYDLNKWEKQKIGNSQLTSIAYSKDKKMIVVVGANEIITSKDGENWTTRYQNNKWMCVKYIDYYGVFICLGLIGMKSEDGYNWTGISIPSLSIGHYYSDVTNNKNRVLIFGNGKEYVSDDLQNWSEYTQSITKAIFSGILNCFIGITSDDIYKSYDGTIWTQIYEGGSQSNFNNIGYSDYQGLINICGRIITQSINGDNWIDILDYLGTCDFYSIKYFEKDNKTICTGFSFDSGRFGCILVIDNFINENIINKLSDKSDLTLGLDKGNNSFIAKSSDGNFITKIKYRQKYIGV